MVFFVVLMVFVVVLMVFFVVLMVFVVVLMVFVVVLMVFFVVLKALIDEPSVEFFELLAGVVLPVFTLRLKCPDLCLLYTSPSPRDRTRSRMPSSA